MKIGFVGFGEVGSTFAADLASRQITGIDLVAYSPDYESTVGACKRIGGGKVSAAKSLSSAISSAVVVFVAVPCNASKAVFSDLSTFCGHGQMFVDCSSSLPEVKASNASVIESHGGVYMDAAIMETVSRHGIETPVLASGRGVSGVAKVLSELGMQVRIVGGEPGEAAAIKLCRSVFMKGLAALAIEARETSEKYGVQEAVFRSIEQSLGGADIQEYLEQLAVAAVRHARRQLAEVGECLEMERSVGVAGHMAQATMKLYSDLV
ncbi:hypothetical protein DMP06_09305 [Slackia equolifaciens]|uniref:NAD(P)-dependent oxidoreductase n=1 Tax=Slackia equolifaciens TaxID=498718 RepID=A0A3N0AU92_9ACTN|nr:NAD(P)-binding domain-containing protein [Slackia equolifaciens]RNL38208.1 hypothetical protein DMP06_09305 [Slackia equolifaciens]